MYAAHNKVDNIISFVDCNGQQIDGSTEDVLSLLRPRCEVVRVWMERSEVRWTQPRRFGPCH